MSQLPLAPLKRLIEEAGAKRVGKDAVRALKDFLEKEAIEISKYAIEFSSHAGRKSVREEDINLALKWRESR